MMRAEVLSGGFSLVTLGAVSLVASPCLGAIPASLAAVVGASQLGLLSGQGHELIAARALRDPAEIALYSAMAFCAIALFFYLASKDVRHPARVTVKPRAAPGQKASEVSPYVQTTSEKLEALGFFQQLDFTIPESLFRCFFRYMSLNDGSHSLLISEISSSRKGTKPMEASKWTRHIEFQTLLTGGVKINTTNCPVPNYFAPPPGQFAMRVPHLSDELSLFDEHRRHVEQVQTREGGAIVSKRQEEFVPWFCEEWERINAYQESVGLLKRDPAGPYYRASPKLILKAMLFGFTEEFGGATGLIIPLLVAVLMGASVWATPIVLRLAGLGHSPALAAECELAAIGILGFAVGLASRMGGGFWAAFCYLPSAILFASGPAGYLAPFVMALGSGGLGEKTAFASTWTSWKDVNQLSLSIFIVAVALALGALWP